MNLADRILFIDAEAIIIDKPSGLPMDPPRDGSLSVASHLRALAMGFKRWPTPVHRLDRDTSGCLLLARTARAAIRFQQAFEARAVKKEYFAVIEGIPASSSGVIEMPLIKRSSASEGWRMVADSHGKPATTRWEVIAEAGARALVRFIPETGRTHQLRVHAASGLGCPIAGDTVYGAASSDGSVPRMMLHASFLSLSREGKAPVEARAPLPAEFATLGFAVQ
jgi:tRNA pseudouridine32 synthase/23S rRNA pseudouridine746 synthase